MGRDGRGALWPNRGDRFLSGTTRRAATVGLAAWLAVSALSAVQSSLRDSSRSWDELLAGTLLAWLPWLLFAIPIYRLNGDSWRAAPWRWFGRHALMAVTTSALYLGYLAVFRSLPRPAAVGVWRSEYREVAGEHLLGALLVYCVLATATHFVRRRSEPPAPGIAPAITVRQQGRKRIVPTEEINWIGAEGSYARLHCGAESHLIRRSLSRLATELQAHGFVRVHRSALINLDRLREVESIGHGDGTLILDSGARVRLSRTYRKALDAALAEF